MDSRQKILKAQLQIDPNPTQQQKLDGDYRKGSLELLGLKIILENSANSYRQGVDESGNPWESLMHNAYGYIEDTIGVDGDEIDVFLNEDFVDDCLIYIVFQKNLNNIFDEHKIMLGFENEQQAYDAYMSNYKKNWKGFMKMITMSQNQFSEWLIDKGTTKRSVQLIKKSNNEVSIKNFEKTKVIEIEGEILEGITLKDLQTQLGDQTMDVVVVKISSPGGNVIEGLMIMMWLNHLSKLGIYVVTVVTANAYSIASLIACCADKATISKHADIMVHDPMLPELKYVNANELETHAKDLRRLEQELHYLYQIFTGIEIDIIKRLMNKETYIGAEDAVRYGFFDEIVDINPRPKSMAKTTNNILDMKNAINALNRVIGMVNNSSVVNQMYYDDKGSEIEIFQQDPSFYSTGDRTSIKDGKVTLSNGAILTIVEGVITDISKGLDKEDPAAVEVPAVEAPAVAAPIVDSSTGPAPILPIEEKKEEIVAVEEEVIEKKEDVSTPIVAIEEKEDPAQDASMMTPEQYQELSDKYDALSSRFDQFLEEFKNNTDASLEFEDLAGKAIEALANNTVSSFKPQARAKSEVESASGTIFSRLKTKRGIK